jgi:hypothetical protein
MSTINIEEFQKWNSRIDSLKERFEIENDSDVAKMLGISPPALNKVRAGKGALGPLTKLIILDKLGFAKTRDALAEILPGDRAEEIKLYSNRMISKRFQKKND